MITVIAINNVLIINIKKNDFIKRLLLIAFANSFDSDQAPTNVGPQVCIQVV